MFDQVDFDNVPVVHMAVPMVADDSGNFPDTKYKWLIQSPTGHSAEFEGDEIMFIPVEAGKWKVSVFEWGGDRYADTPSMSEEMHFPDDFDGFTEEDAKIGESFCKRYFNIGDEVVN